VIRGVACWDRMSGDAGRLAFCTRIPVWLLVLLLGMIVAVGPAQAERGLRKGPRPRPEESATSPPSAPTPEARAYPFSDAAAANAAAEARLDSLRVRYADGRSPESLTVYQRDEGAYLDLGDLGRVTGGGFRWNPETWRGSFLVDSVVVDLVLDTAVFWIRGEAVNLPAPVRYAGERVLVPLGILDGVVAPLLGDRCHWDPNSGELDLALGKPWLETPELNGGGAMATLTLAPVPGEAVRFRWDPMGQLFIEIKGPHVQPEPLRANGRVDGCEVASIRSTKRGCELVLRLDPQWMGVRVRTGRTPQTLIVDLTSRPADVDRAHFDPLGSYLDPRNPQERPSGPGREILLEVALPPGEGGNTACLLALAERLRSALEQDFGHHVVMTDDRSKPGLFRTPLGLSEIPGLPDGDCWVGLRLESWPSESAREFLLVVPGEPARQELVAARTQATSATAGDQTEFTGGSAAGLSPSGGRVIPWGQVSRPFEASSRTLARTMAEHLSFQWEGRPLRIMPRPARIFRGMAMPGVLLYPAAATDAGALNALCDETKSAELARNLAFALDEFLLGLAED
jgi:hypothetical protein